MEGKGLTSELSNTIGKVRGQRVNIRVEPYKMEGKGFTSELSNTRGKVRGQHQS